ncbi:diaminopimelate decarboxylase [Candidatus Carsonella ruddii]|uniref:Diaminopimelate decarboxylase n=1 Tax=Carsonella ruddii TaxID=114186 RepID=A0A2K8K5U2_CARRU|nr:diaminopimelate decarboxylase [Candidatus Carsonella ruddii]ATX33424.1 diaminopimelate decarboxylase [Candidatus Carsonella ruddii]
MIEIKNIENKILINKILINVFFQKFELPIYVYDYKKIIFNCFFIKKLIFFVFYSIKSNDNLFLLKIINNIINKFDIVSIGELKKILLISIKKPYIIFSGSGKNISELLISLNLNIFCLNIESIQEFIKIFFLIKKYKKKINLMIRINPNIDAKTHEKISTGIKVNKFGISVINLKNLFILNKITKLNIIGYDFHIGSQIEKISPIKKLLNLIINLYKIKKFDYLDIGGGIGVNYYINKNIIKFSNYYNIIIKILKKKKINLKIFLEIGRYFLTNSCILFSKINYIKFNKSNNLTILNLGMNDIIRPSLYDSYHKIENNNIGNKIKNFFGPICESSDKFINNKFLNVKNNSIIFFYSSGSYCKVMSNNYNSKFKIYEIIVYKNKIKIIFKIEKFKNIIKNYA